MAVVPLLEEGGGRELDIEMEMDRPHEHDRHGMTGSTGWGWTFTYCFRGGGRWALAVMSVGAKQRKAGSMQVCLWGLGRTAKQRACKKVISLSYLVSSTVDRTCKHARGDAAARSTSDPCKTPSDAAGGGAVNLLDGDNPCDRWAVWAKGTHGCDVN